MSLLTPDRVPVKVYRSDDVGAPVLNKTANCVLNIFKACLVDGYGSKNGAGWTSPFLGTGINVFRPDIGPHTDFYLQLSADTGTEVVAQVYLNMTAINTGDLKLQCATAFKYAKGVSTGRWLLIASPRGFWFFCEQGWTGAPEKQKLGAFLFCGDLSVGSNQVGRPVFLQHTGGTVTTGEFSSVLGVSSAGTINKGANAYLMGKILVNNVVSDADIFDAINGSYQHTTSDFANLACIFSNKNLYIVPGTFIPLSGAAYLNFEAKIIATDSTALNIINFGTGGWGATNTYISTDEWVY